jgi:hypothetical protein
MDCNDSKVQKIWDKLDENVTQSAVVTWEQTEIHKCLQATQEYLRASRHIP